MVMAESTLIEQPQVTAHPAVPNVAGDSEKPRGFGNLLLRIVLATATTLVSINLWSGGPLLALWVGSRIQTAVGSLSMAAIGATVGVLIVETFLLYRLLAWLSIRYDAAIGRKVPRRQAPWLKPMSGERRTLEVRRPLTAVERIVVGSVVILAEAGLVWFFFFAHYSLPG
jgi:hypothetical protein